MGNLYVNEGQIRLMCLNALVRFAPVLRFQDGSIPEEREGLLCKALPDDLFIFCNENPGYCDSPTSSLKAVGLVASG